MTLSLDNTADTVWFNVGGTRFETRRDTLAPSAYFSALLDVWEDGIFIDRDPELFGHILLWMRDSRYRIPYIARPELDYYGITPIPLVVEDNSITTLGWQMDKIPQSASQAPIFQMIVNKNHDINHDISQIHGVDTEISICEQKIRVDTGSIQIPIFGDIIIGLQLFVEFEQTNLTAIPYWHQAMTGDFTLDFNGNPLMRISAEHLHLRASVKTSNTPIQIIDIPFFSHAYPMPIHMPYGSWFCLHTPQINAKNVYLNIKWKFCPPNKLDKTQTMSPVITYQSHNLNDRLIGGDLITKIIVTSDHPLKTISITAHGIIIYKNLGSLIHVEMMNRGLHPDACTYEILIEPFIDAHRLNELYLSYESDMPCTGRVFTESMSALYYLDGGWSNVPSKQIQNQANVNLNSNAVDALEIIMTKLEH